MVLVDYIGIFYISEYFWQMTNVVYTIATRLNTGIMMTFSLTVQDNVSLRKHSKTIWRNGTQENKNTAVWITIPIFKSYPLKNGVNSGAPEGLAVPAPLVTPVVLF
jgi:hypothetical protein